MILKSHKKEVGNMKDEMTINLLENLEELIENELSNLKGTNEDDTDLKFVKYKLMYYILKFNFESQNCNNNIINNYRRDYYWFIKDNPKFEFKIP